MKILYKQFEDDIYCALRRFNVHDCCLKKLLIEQDSNRVTKKPHHHTGFELHIIIEGSQEYEICGSAYKLDPGSFLLIYPNTPHTVISQEAHTEKYSITFNKQTNDDQTFLYGNCIERTLDDLIFISNESAQNKEISSILIENSILEILVRVFRLSGIKENKKVQIYDDNPIVSLVKQYINDNIEFDPNVPDVAKYCYLSTKQLTRLFNKFEGISPGEYIIKARVAKIKELISDYSISIKQISNIMHFNNEYYFNSFFKKHFGMPPGEYRKMLGQ